MLYIIKCVGTIFPLGSISFIMATSGRGGKKRDDETIQKKTVGVNLGKRLVRTIDQPLEYGDSRSERVRYLVELGIAAEKGLGDLVDELEEGHHADVVRQACVDYRRKQ